MEQRRSDVRFEGVLPPTFVEDTSHGNYLYVDVYITEGAPVVEAAAVVKAAMAT